MIGVRRSRERIAKLEIHWKGRSTVGNTIFPILLIIVSAIGVIGGWYIGEAIQGEKEEATEPNCLGDNNLLREEK